MATAALAKNSKEEIFEWEGKDKNGRLVRGEIRAGGEAVVSASLRRQGILLTKVRKRRTSGGRAIKQKDIAIFTRQLSTMMKAGVPLLQSFDIVARGSNNPRLTKLLTDIRSALKGELYLSEAARHSVASGYSYTDKRIDGEYIGLTAREREIIRMIAQERTNGEIASALFLSEDTVKTHRKNLMTKLNVRSVAGLVKYAIDRRWI
jgi:DNA-binding CsgD family transcriptional regulator